MPRDLQVVSVNRPNVSKDGRKVILEFDNDDSALEAARLLNSAFELGITVSFRTKITNESNES